ncbi:DDE-type integrase/transposase/recombinase [Cetobacterium sp.]|uniref:DDE-type integrase/transposase/recombinase n=1 Tax=Cetobacterium sp. TaxID=2071632 RepID=UPI003F2FF6AD
MDRAQKFPYLWKNIKNEKPNMVCSTDITYLKTPTGFMYLTAIIDVYSRKILTWEL